MVSIQGYIYIYIYIERERERESEISHTVVTRRAVEYLICKNENLLNIFKLIYSYI